MAPRRRRLQRRASRRQPLIRWLRRVVRTLDSSSCRFRVGVRVLRSGAFRGIITLGCSWSLADYAYFARLLRNRVVVPHSCGFGLFFLLFACAASGIGNIGRVFLMILLLLWGTRKNRIHRKQKQNRESWPCALHRSSPKDKFRSSNDNRAAENPAKGLERRTQRGNPVPPDRSRGNEAEALLRCIALKKNGILARRRSF